MNENQLGSTDTDSASQDDVQETQVDDTDESSQSSDAAQQTSGSDEDLPEAYRGKTAKDIAEMHLNLEKKLGNWKDVEEKAKAFERLSRSKQTPAPVARPQLGQFITDDGTIDVQSYDRAMLQYETRKDQYSEHASRRSAQEASDSVRAERDFPFIATDTRAQKLAYSLYASGEVGTLYEAVQEVADMRNETATTAKQTGAKEKEREIAKKVRGKTEGSGSKDTSGVITPETFASFTREEKRAYINKMAASAEE